MKVEVGAVMSFKLNSGEELVAKVEQDVDSDGYILLGDPVSIAPGPQGMGLVPSMFTIDHGGKARLNSNSIAIIAMTDESVKAKYIQATTGITVPDKKIVMG